MAAFLEILRNNEEVVAVVIGVFLAFLLEWISTARKRRGHFSALQAEMELCRALAETYLQHKISAPLYRLPTMAYAHSLPELLGSAALGKKETKALLEFFTEVETLNRGLDQAQAVRDDAKKLKEEVERNEIKAGHLVPNQSYYHQARSILDGRLRWYRWFW